MRSVSRNPDRNKCGQTSRLVVGTEIQTSCNFKANLCDRFHLMAFLCWLFSITITIGYGIICILLCLIISIFSYTKIFHTLRHHQNQVQDHVQQPNQTNQLNMARYKKAVSSAKWLQLTLVACYLPYVIDVIVPVYTSFYFSWSCTVTLVYLNSSLNPILYCWKIEEVRQTVKDTIRQLLCFVFRVSLCRPIW